MNTVGKSKIIRTCELVGWIGIAMMATGLIIVLTHIVLYVTAISVAFSGAFISVGSIVYRINKIS